MSVKLCDVWCVYAISKYTSLHIKYHRFMYGLLFYFASSLETEKTLQIHNIKKNKLSKITQFQS